jgi:hypothetical protein
VIDIIMVNCYTNLLKDFEVIGLNVL